ncbi:MAG: DUF1385 domain-containing protein [Dehalococcoidales bacterium]|jgi:uncharacterized protein YqhQ|nr:DUF1385 domain-containing protein [Dehalococcoidales bacterium]NLE90370.1 DUF1385 domain-containing protein [Dehalococcoidales bacterium]
MSDCKVNYGGQAVMEGVMMRGKEFAVTAVRNPAGKVVIRAQKLGRIYTGKLRKTPFLRGIIVLVESLVLGLSSLSWSANVALEEEAENGETKQEISSAWTWAIMAVSFIFGIALFFVLPLLLTRLLDSVIESSILFHLVEGVIRLAIFLLYLKIISTMSDIKRVFSYHGAEHKTINAYEHGEPLKPEYIQKYSTAHARCGTAFLLSVMVLAILVFSLVGKQVLWLMILTRILLLPVIAALGYEITQLCSRHMSNLLARIIIAPGMWLQSLTTGEPDDNQVEVAVAALEEVIRQENGATTSA